MDISPHVRNFYFLNQEFLLNKSYPIQNANLLSKMNKYIKDIQNLPQDNNNKINQIEITEKDIIAFYTFFKNEPLLFSIQRLKTNSYITTSFDIKNNQIISEVNLIKMYTIYLYLIITINESVTSHNENNLLLFECTSSLFYSMYKSYINSLLSEKTFLKLIQFILYLGLNSENNSIIDLKYLDLFFKIINQLFMNNNISSKKENNINVLTELIKYFSEQILSNEKNIYLFNQNPNLLSNYIKLIFIIQQPDILLINNKSLNDFINEYKKSILTIYSYSFTYNNIMKLFIDIFKNVLFDIDKKSFNELQHDLYLCNFPFEYINENISLYNNQNNNSVCIKQGIVMNNTNDSDNSVTKCGIVSYCINKNILDVFQIVFSFCIKPSLSENEQTLITIYGNIDKITWLKISFVPIENNSVDYLMKITIKENPIALAQEIVIKCNQDYFFSISCNKNGDGEIKQLYTGNNKQDSNDVSQRSFALNKKSNDNKNKNMSNLNKLICYIGCDHKLKQCTFNGIIGRTILFSQITTKTVQKNSNNDNTSENTINRYFTKTNVNLNYSNLINLLAFPVNECKIELDISNSDFQFINHNENAKYNNFIVIKNKQVNFTPDIITNYKSFKSNYNSKKTAFNRYIHLLNKTNPIHTFYDCNALDYLILVLEYYYQILIRLPHYNNQVNNIIKSEELSKLINNSISEEESILLVNNYIVPNLCKVFEFIEQLVKLDFIKQTNTNNSINKSLNQLFSQIFILLFQIFKPRDNSSIILFIKCLNILTELSKDKKNYLFSFFQQFFDEEKFSNDNDFLIILFDSLKIWFHSFKNTIPSMITDSIQFIEKCFDSNMNNGIVSNSFSSMLNSYFILVYTYYSNRKDNSVITSFPYLINKSLAYFHNQIKQSQNEQRILLINNFLNVFAEEKIMHSYIKADIETFNEILSLIEKEVLDGMKTNKFNQKSLEQLILLTITIKLCQLSFISNNNSKFNMYYKTYFINEFPPKFILDFKNENSTVFYILNIIEKLITNALFKDIYFNSAMCSSVLYLMIYIQKLIEETKEGNSNQRIVEAGVNEYINNLEQFYEIYNRIIKQMAIDNYYNVELTDYLFTNASSDFVLFYTLNAQREDELSENDGTFYENLFQIMIGLFNKQSHPFVFDFISNYFSKKNINSFPPSHEKWIIHLEKDILSYYHDSMIANKQSITNKFQLRNIINLLLMLYSFVMNISDPKILATFDIIINKKQISFLVIKIIDTIKEFGFFNCRICVQKYLLIEMLFDLLMNLIILCNKDSTLNSCAINFAKLIEQIFKFNKNDSILNTINLKTIPKELKFALDKEGIENDLCVDCEKIYNVNFHVLFFIKLSIYYHKIKEDKGPKSKNIADKYIYIWRKGLLNYIMEEDKKQKGTFIKNTIDLINDEKLKTLLNEYINKCPSEKGPADFTLNNELFELIMPSLYNLCQELLNKKLKVIENLDEKEFKEYNNKTDGYKAFILIPPHEKTYSSLLNKNLSFQYGITYTHKSLSTGTHASDEDKNSNLTKDEERDITNSKSNLSNISNDISKMTNESKRNSILFGEIHCIKHTDYLTLPKRTLLKTIFAHNFKDYFFHNESFQMTKQIFSSLFETSLISKQLTFPSKLKNFSNKYESNFFLKHDTSFFQPNNCLTVTHSYLEQFVTTKKTFPQFNFINKPFLYNLYKEPNTFYFCEYISINVAIKGKIFIKENCFIFKSIPFEKEKYKNDVNFVFASLDSDVVNKDKVICIPLKEIEEIVTKRFVLLDQAFEIHTKSGKTYFFNIYLPKHLTSFLNELTEVHSLGKKIINIRTLFPKLKLNNKWKTGEISSYKYILLLNKFSSRSLNDINQYYIFPWLLKEYAHFNQIKIKSLTDENGTTASTKVKNSMKQSVIEINEDTTNPQQIKMSEHIREFQYPICVQNEKNKERAASKYEASQYNNVMPSKSNWFYHFGNHYSTSSYILYYKMRQNPFTSELVKLQSNSQENSNRMFISLSETQNIINNILDSRELIPEFFSTLEFMINLNCSFFGYRIKGLLVDDAILPEQETLTQDQSIFAIQPLNNYVDFIRRHRLMLDNPLLSDQLVMWFNSIFGEGQFYENESKNKASYNLYIKTSYEEKTNLNAKLQKYLTNKKYTENQMILKLESKVTQILNFGQTPIRLYKKAHIHKDKELTSNDEGEFQEFGLQFQKMQRSSKKDKQNKKNNNSAYIFFLVDKNNTRCLLLNNDSGITIYDINDDEQTQPQISTIDNDNTLKQNDQQVLEYNLDESDYSTGSEKELMEIQKSNKPKEKPKSFFREIFSLSNKSMFTYACEIPPSDMKLFKYNQNQYQYSNKYCIIALYSFTHIITCRHKDHTLHLNILSKNENTETVSIHIIQLNNFAYSLCKVTETKFLCGLSMGQLLYYKHDSLKKDSYILTSSFYDHDSPIVTIDINKRLNIILTSSLNGNIHIRKSYDFELLSVIHFNNLTLIPLLVTISNCNFLYVLYKDISVEEGNNDNNVIYGYTLNGLFFGKSEYGNYNGLTTNEDGDVFTGVGDKNILCCIKGSFKPKMRRFWFMLFNYGSIEKSKVVKDEDMKRKLVWFTYEFKGKKRYLYFLDDLGTLQLMKHYNLKKFDFFK